MKKVWIVFFCTDGVDHVNFDSAYDNEAAAKDYAEKWNKFRKSPLYHWEVEEHELHSKPYENGWEDCQ